MTEGMGPYEVMFIVRFTIPNIKVHFCHFS